MFCVGVRELYSQVTDSSREQQVVLSELFNRISFLQNFMLLEAHTLSSGLYNAAGLCTAFLLTCIPRTARSRYPAPPLGPPAALPPAAAPHVCVCLCVSVCVCRLVLLGLVCVNVYLERLIYQCVMDSSNPAHTHMVSTTITTNS